MNHVSQGRMIHIYHRMGFLFLIMMSIISSAMSVNCIAEDVGGVDHFKMISTLEYTGDGQYRNQAESGYSVTKEFFANDRVRYSFVMHDANSTSGKKTTSDFSLVIDKSTGLMSAAGKELAFWAQVHNETIKSLNKVTKEYIGKTWKQSVDLSSVDDCPLSEISFTLTAIDVKTRAFGDMVAVRALSEPFFLTIDKGPLRCKINTIFLFDSNIDNVYLSISVFEATTDAHGIREILRHEVATYRTDATGKPYDLSDVGKDFEALVAKVGLRKESLKVAKEAKLPKWAHTKGISVAQVANICAGAVCEGALNPVATVTVPRARLMLEQSLGAGAATESILTKLVSQFGWNIPTAAVIAAITTTAIVVSQDDDGHDYP